MRRNSCSRGDCAAVRTRVNSSGRSLLHCRARQIIHNPRYAGAFVFGRTKQRHLPNGKVCSRLVPSEEWILLRDVHPGYITWEEYQLNRQRVKGNALAWSAERHRGPAREGTALLQGLVICGTCGERMSVRYHSHRNQSVPTYWCGRGPCSGAKTVFVKPFTAVRSMRQSATSSSRR